jgi:hypothetical protein
MSSHIEIASSVEEWLHGEHSYQFAKFDKAYGDELQQRRNFIANSEIPNKWQRGVLFRAGGAFLLANQQLLKVCAATRAVTVYDACILGAEKATASDQSFNELHDYFANLTLNDLPDPDILNARFGVVFPDTDPSIRFRRAGLLAIVGLLDSEAATGKIQLPLPGLPSGQTK